MSWVEEFYTKFTDGCDKENDYYDAQFTVSKPCEVEMFIHNLLENKQKPTNMSEENKFAKGIFFDKPRENAPEFVRGRLSIKKLEAIAYLSALEPSEAGFINFDLLKSKDGTKLYFTLNDWKPEKKMTEAEAKAVFDGQAVPPPGFEAIKPEDIPF